MDFAIRNKFKNSPSNSWPEIIRDEFIPWLARVHDPLQRQLLIHRICKTASLPPEIITGMLRQVQSGVRRTPLTRPAEQLTVAALRLTQEGFDLLGNLFFAQPAGEDVLAEARSLVDQLEWHPVVARFANAMIESLAAKVTPADDPALMAWDSVQEPVMEAMVKRLAGRRSAFAAADLSQGLQVLSNRLKRNEVLAQRAKLKAQLGVANLEDQLLLLRQIDDINKSLNALE